MPGSVASTTESPSAGRGRRRAAGPGRRSPADGAAQAPDPGGAEEWPGQSRGFVGPNGEGAYTKEDRSKLDEFEVWGRVYEPENELPSVVEGDYVRGVLMVCFDRGIGELAAHEIVWARGGVWGYDFFRLGDDGPASAEVYFPDAPDREDLEVLAAELRSCPGVVSVDLDGMCYLEGG